MGEPGASVDALVLLRRKTGPLCTSSTRSCRLPVPHHSGPNDVGEDKCFPAYVRNITLHVHNLNIMQRFIKFYFPSSPRRTFQLSWAVHFFFFFFGAFPTKSSEPTDRCLLRSARGPAAGARVLETKARDMRDEILDPTCPCFLILGPQGVAVGRTGVWESPDLNFPVLLPDCCVTWGK